jgi:GMP synthase (glutamine-hydrolysing)
MSSTSPAGSGLRAPVALCVRHLAFEDLGTFEAVLAERGFEVRVLDAGVDPLFESIIVADLTIMMGGPIGVYEEELYPFLTEELRALSVRLRERRPTLGICLGAQLVAAALGARVFPGPQKEIGWAALQLTESGRASCLRELEGQPVLHWHGDTFELPAGAELLASTSAYSNQAFAVGPTVLGLQFHPEVDARRFEQWLIGHGGELAAAKLDIAKLRATVKDGGRALQAAAARMLGRWLDGLTE